MRVSPSQAWTNNSKILEKKTVKGFLFSPSDARANFPFSRFFSLSLSLSLSLSRSLLSTYVDYKRFTLIMRGNKKLFLERVQARGTISFRWLYFNSDRERIRGNCAKLGELNNSFVESGRIGRFYL